MTPGPDVYSDAITTSRARRRAIERRRARIRRRRLVAASGLLLIIVLVLLLAGGGVQHPRLVPSRPAAPSAKPAPRVPRRAETAATGSAIDRLLARQPFISSGGGERREIALTFDDGPGPYTPRLLDQLAKLHAPATFFEIGSMIHYFHPSLTREEAMGAVIGDHTELHPMMAELSPVAQEAQIVTQTKQLARYGAPFPRLYRPPYGSFNRATLSILKRFHMLMVLWSTDTEDYRQPGVAVIVRRALAGARPGAILLMHDAGGTRTQTIAALPLIVSALRKRGYRLVTVPQLIRDDPPRRIQRLPSALAGG
ncbi:MAG: polysaccharide deacetylase family protein [Solirubrobacterales bacterium]|nr:polysaccharide deacetylase family protein [Solirubrobacterales bacterium]